MSLLHRKPQKKSLRETLPLLQAQSAIMFAKMHGNIVYMEQQLAQINAQIDEIGVGK